MTETTIASGVTSSGLTLTGADQLEVLAGGEVISTTVSSSSVAPQAVMDVYGVAIGTTLLGGAEPQIVQVWAGGVTRSSVLESYGEERLQSGGTSISATLSAGGQEIVQSGGLAVDPTVRDNGEVVVEQGGVASGMIVSSGGLPGVGLPSPFGTGSGGGYVRDATILSSGQLNAADGGWTRNTTVSAGGLLVIDAGGLALTTLILNSGVETVYSGGIDSGAIVSSGGFLGGIAASGAGLEAGKLEVFSGGTVSGLAVATVVSSGVVYSGVDMLYDGGIEIDVSIDEGALDLARRVFGDGDVVVAGAVSSTTVISGVTLNPGAILETYSAVLSSGATESVTSGGIAAGTIVSSGGKLIVAAGGIIEQGLILAGGTAIIAQSIASTDTVSFTRGSAVLELGAPTAFRGQIEGFSQRTQRLDLDGFAYSSGETWGWSEAASNTSGTLRVADGGQVARLTLLGVYTTQNFALSDDGHGGTSIRERQVAGFAQAMAVMGGGSNTPADGAFQTPAGSVSPLGAPPLIPSGVTSAALHSS